MHVSCTGCQSPGFNADSFGGALKLIHDAFRRELSNIRKEVAESGRPTLGAQLRMNCLAACQGLHFHHTGEDNAIFPSVLAANPELAPTIERLNQEHKEIAVLIDSCRRPSPVTARTLGPSSPRSSA